MFESAMGRSEASSSRLGTGAILSGVVHLLFGALVFIVPGKTKAMQDDTPPVVEFREFVAPEPPGGGSPGPVQPVEKVAAPAPRPKAAPIPIQDKPTPEPIEDKPKPSAPNSETPTGNESAAPAGPPGGGAGTGVGQGSGGTGGSGPGTGNGPAEPAPTYTVINWNSTMERPVLIAGPSKAEYPRSAMLQHREGTVIARCRIMVDGSVRECSIVAGDVMMQQAVLDALAQQRYRPLMYEGAPVSVRYMFRFTFKLL